MKTIHRSPSTVALSLECDGETTVTTWGEFLAANRRNPQFREHARNVWQVITKQRDAVALIDVASSSVITVRRGEGGDR